MNDTIKAIIHSALVAEGIPAEVISAGTFVIEHPADLSKGDYSTNAALVYAKVLKRNPVELANALVSHIKLETDADITRVEVAGPGFINFFLSSLFFGKQVKVILENPERFGHSSTMKGQVWAVEYASPNPNKAMHLGHLRNTITGVALCNLLEANGATVIREMVDNNRGISIAKLMWGYLVSAKKDGNRVEDLAYWQSHKDEWHTITASDRRVLDVWYVTGSEECKDPAQEAKVRELVVKWEAKDPVVWDLWKTVLDFAYLLQKATLTRLGATFDYVWHEHEHYEEGKRYVDAGVKTGVFRVLEDGAILTTLESFGLSDTIVQKNDGTSLYITQDIALTDLKKKKHNADHQVWVIGPEQSLALQQLFAVCEQLGIGMREEFSHVSYGYVTIKGQGKMSSREGNVLYADDLLDELRIKTEGIMAERLSGQDKSVIAEKIALGAAIYEMLKAGRTKDIAFDMESALSFEGDSGPYLQYAHTRALSIMRKAKEQGIGPDVDGALPHEESELIRKIYRLPEVIEEAAKLYAPQQVVTFLTDLAATFNNYYAHTQVIADNDATSGRRVALVAAFAEVMESGLKVLGIKTPGVM